MLPPQSATSQSEGYRTNVGRWPKLEAAKQMVNETAGKVSIAAINGTTNITLAGDTTEIDRIAAELTHQNIFQPTLGGRSRVSQPDHGPFNGTAATSAAQRPS